MKELILLSGIFDSLRYLAILSWHSHLSLFPIILVRRLYRPQPSFFKGHEFVDNVCSDADTILGIFGKETGQDIAQECPLWQIAKKDLAWSVYRSGWRDLVILAVLLIMMVSCQGMAEWLWFHSRSLQRMLFLFQFKIASQAFFHWKYPKNFFILWHGSWLHGTYPRKWVF